jgi:hypothetical protein
MADEDRNYQFTVYLGNVPEFGNLRIIYRAKYKEGQDKAQKLPKFFSGDTKITKISPIAIIKF